MSVKSTIGVLCSLIFLLAGISQPTVSQQEKPENGKKNDTITIELGETITIYVRITNDAIEVLDTKKGAFKEKDTLVFSFFDTANGPNLTIDNQTGRVIAYRSFRILNGQLVKNHPVPSPPGVLARESYRDKFTKLIITSLAISDFDKQFQESKRPNA